MSLHAVSAKEVPFGVQKRKILILPLFCPKTPKLAFLAGANGKLKAHNSGTESGIHFKPGSSNDYMTAVISQHSKTAKIEIFA